MTTLITIIITSVLSAVLTLAIGYYVFKKHIEEDFRAALDKKLAEVGVALEERVKEGVRQGVLEGVAQIPSAEVIKDATDSVLKTGQTIVEGGLNSLLGTPGKRPR